MSRILSVQSNFSLHYFDDLNRKEFKKKNNPFLLFQDETTNTTSRSELSFVPSTEDDGKSITCRAENPKVTGLFLETAWKLNVVCKYKNAMS